MLNLFEAPTESSQIDLFPEKKIDQDYTASFRDYLSKLYSTSQERDVSEDIDLGFLVALQEEQRGKNAIRVASEFRQSLPTKIETQPLPVIQEEVTKEEKKADAIQGSNIPEIDDFIFRNEQDNIFTKSDQVKLHRMEVAKRIFADKFDQSSQGVLPAIGYFLDTLVSFPKDLVYGGGFTRESMSEQIMTLASDPFINEKEFQEKVGGLVDSAADVGFFSDSNPFYTSQFLEDLEHGADTDKIFTALDAGLGAAGLAKRLVRAVDAVDLLTLTKPNNVAAAQVLNAAQNGGGGVNVARHTSPASVTPGNNLRGFYSAPDHQALVQMETSNKVLNIIDSKDWGSFIQPEIFAANRQELLNKTLAEVQQYGNNRLISHDVEYQKLGNLLGVGVLGTSKGKYFLRQRDAQALADIVSGSVIEQLENNRIVYGVRKEINLPGGKLFTPIGEEDISTHILQSITSPGLTTSIKHDNILKRGEGQIGTVNRDVLKNFEKVDRKTNKEDKEFISGLYTRLRDDPAYSMRKDPLTQQEFITEYRNAKGRDPSPQAVKYHEQFQEVANTAYYVIADDPFKKAVNEGHQVLMNGGVNRNVVVADAADIEDVDIILNLDTGHTVTKNQLRSESVYSVYGGVRMDQGQLRGQHIRYVATASPKTRRLYHTDVVPYNVGGPRVYEDFKYYIKQESNMRVAKRGVQGGESIPTHPITVMGTVTEKEAHAAVNEMNLLFRGLKNQFNFMGGVSKFNTNQILRGSNNNTALVRFIQDHNQFNRNIQEPSDLAEFLERYNLDIDEDIGFAAHTEPLRYIDPVNQKSAFTGGLTYGSGRTTYGDTFLRASNSKARRDQPLLGYGGLAPDTLTPLEASQRAFARAINLQAEAAYRFNAVEGWLKGAEKYIVNPAQLEGMRPYERMINAKLSNVKGSKAFEQERRVIQRRIETQSGFAKTWENMVNDLGNFVYDKGAKKMGISIKNTFSSDPTIALRSLAFDLKLGLFAFPQLFIQSNQIVNVMAIAGRHGLQGGAIMWPLRLALHNGNEKVVRDIGRRSKMFTGLTDQEFVDLWKFTQRSGKGEIDQTVIEQSQDFSFALGAVNRVRKAGRVFFNEGERLPRLAAVGTAYKRFQEQFPGQALTDRRAELWMAGEIDRLTASMTRASSTAWQKNSLLSVPMQFMSYTSRMLEQIFTNRILTGKERARLATMQLTVWGLSGYGLGGMLNYLVDEGAVEIDQDTYTVLRYGMLDYIIGEATGARTGFGERFAFGEGFYDMMEKLTTDEFWKVIGGPSTSIATDTFGSLSWLVGDFMHGRVDLVNHDMWKTMRNLSSVNTAYNSWFLWKTGEYYSRNGQLLADGMGGPEALFNLMGAPLQSVSVTYEFLRSKKANEDMLNEHGKRIQEMVSVVNQKYADGDVQGGEAVMKEAAMMMAVLEPWERKKIQHYFETQVGSMVERVAIQQIMSMQNSPLIANIVKGNDE